MTPEEARPVDWFVRAVFAVLLVLGIMTAMMVSIGVVVVIAKVF
jgi:hypothetical protein